MEEEKGAESVQKSLASEGGMFQMVGVGDKVSEDVTEGKTQSSLQVMENVQDVFQMHVISLQKVQEFMLAQAKAAEEMTAELKYLRKGKDRLVQSQLLLKQKEEENVGMQVLMNSQKQQFEQEVLRLKSIMPGMD